MKTKRTSLSDIAKALNVSKATVSFVLNDKGDEFNISKKKQELVRAKAKEMSYVPNFFAKSLRQGETKTIGLVLPDISNPFYAELCKTIQEKLYEKGYTTFIINSNEDKAQETALMRGLIQRCIDGMIIAPSNDIKELIPVLLETHIPVVFTDRRGDNDADFVGINNVEEAEKLVESFTVKPKKITAFSPVISEVSTISERIKGIESACKDRNISLNFETLSSNQSDVDEVVKRELKNGSDSFVALNSQTLFKVFSSLKTLGIEVPKDVKIISFDDNEAYQYMSPTVSAVRQPVVDLGVRSVERMLERLKKTKSAGEHFLLPCEFIARESH